MLTAAILLSAACTTLGWFFVHQQIGTVTDGLYRSGTLLAQDLAANSRYGLVAGDREELIRLGRGILAVNDVSYVSIFTAEGRPLIMLGKGPWERLLATPNALTAPLNPALPALDLPSPAIGEVRLMNGNAAFSPRGSFSVWSILSLLVGRELELFYDISVPIQKGESVVGRDSSLGLLFEYDDEPVRHTEASAKPVLGIVEVGMSSLLVQAQLRTLMWQALGITCLILVLSLLLLGFFSYRITTPLQRLTDAANRVAAGETRIDPQPLAAGEIGHLTRVFVHMLQSIHEREAALQDMNLTLEARIAARTEELRLANTKLQELDRRKSLFVSAASHEIKTPLTSITCHLDNLLTGVDGPLAKEQAKVIERVQVNIERLEHLLVDMLDLCKIELGETTLDLRAVNLSTVVFQATESLESLASRKGVRFDRDLAPELPLVTADDEKVYQILTNLLHNAIKFSPNYGTVRVSARQTAGGAVQIAVQDSGCGIARGETEKIFVPFYRSKHAPLQTRGTGLGLPIARHLAELHGGRLWVESDPGHGASFFFTLPVRVEAPQDDPLHGEPALASNQSSRLDGRSTSA
jgi:signal transduction histidine kinase